ncbi:MAG: NAD(P)-dependent oxidoreductase [Synergistaceae bacterium]|nr:NAD(P)-dependent oxidoreductase [Synergistaceae bacterium]
MSKILVTGADGFIGSYFVKELDKDLELLQPSINELNLYDAQSVKNFIERERPEYLMHFAWNVNAGYQESSENFDLVLASLNLLKYFAENGGKRAVFAGSCMEYDWSYGFVKEDFTPLKPDTFYGKCKALLYQLASEYARKVNLSFACGRIFFLYGQGEKRERLMPHLINCYKQNQTPDLKFPFLRRDYMHVKDVAAAFYAILKSDYNGSERISSGNAIALCDIANKIAALTGHEILNYDLNNLNLDNAPAPLVMGDNNILNNIIKFRPQVSWDEGLGEMIKNY